MIFIDHSKHNITKYLKHQIIYIVPQNLHQEVGSIMGPYARRLGYISHDVNECYVLVPFVSYQNMYRFLNSLNKKKSYLITILQSTKYRMHQIIYIVLHYLKN